MARIAFHMSRVIGCPIDGTTTRTKSFGLRIALRIGVLGKYVRIEQVYQLATARACHLLNPSSREPELLHHSLVEPCRSVVSLAIYQF